MPVLSLCVFPSAEACRQQPPNLVFSRGVYMARWIGFRRAEASRRAPDRVAAAVDGDPRTSVSPITCTHSWKASLRGARRRSKRLSSKPRSTPTRCGTSVLRRTIADSVYIAYSATEQRMGSTVRFTRRVIMYLARDAQ